MKKVFVFGFALVFLCMSLLAWRTPAARADECTSQLFWTLMEGITLEGNQFPALLNYVQETNLSVNQDILRARLKAAREAIKKELLETNPDSERINALAQEVATNLNQLIDNRVHFMAFLAGLLTPEQLDIFRGNGLDMALELSKKGNILLRLIKIVRDLGLPLDVRSHLGDLFLGFLRDQVVPLRSEMAKHGLTLRLLVRQNLGGLDDELGKMASLRTQIVINRINFALQMRDLIGIDKMAAYFDALEAEFTPLCQEE